MKQINRPKWGKNMSKASYIAGRKKEDEIVAAR